MVKLGQLLHQQRIRRRLTLEDVAKATKIKAAFLAAIERGEYHKLPSPAYAKGFVTNYATYLGLPRTEVFALFRREFDEKRAYKVLPDSLTKKTDFPLKRIKIRESLFIASIIVVLFLGFLLFQYRSVFIAPSLHVTSPKEGVVITGDVTVSGKADSEATVTVNNDTVSLDNNGAFLKKITLFPGKSVVTIKAKNRFGKESVVRRDITTK